MCVCVCVFVCVWRPLLMLLFALCVLAATVADMLFKTRDRVHKIVLYLHERFAASHRDHCKRAAVLKVR